MIGQIQFGKHGLFVSTINVIRVDTNDDKIYRITYTGGDEKYYKEDFRKGWQFSFTIVDILECVVYIQAIIHE